jgi:hypothetical protein
MLGKAECHIAPLAGEDIHQQTKTLGATLNVFEHDARTILRAQHRFGGQADIVLPIGVAHDAHFAQLIG